MNPIGAFGTVILCLIAFSATPRVAVVAIVLGVCYLTQGVNLQIGLNFTGIRLVLLAGFARAVVRGEFKRVSINSIDRWLIAYAVCLLVVSVVREPKTETLTYEAGNLYNVLLSYFVCRALLTSEEDIRAVLTQLTFCLIPFVLLMYWEARTGTNLFAILGGVSTTSMFRDGHYRAQAAFRSPITAGSFGATLGLLYSGMLFARGRQGRALFGLILSLIIAIFCARSSGPVLGFLVGICALACWPFRQHTKKIRWAIVISLVGLQIVMKSPVWFLLGRISDLVGGGGYHRAYIIDHFVNSFGTWWFDGMSDTSSWMPTQLESGGADITNQFVSDGLNAGLVGLLISIMVLVRCFQSVGISIRAAEGVSNESQKFYWALGATLVGNIGILFSVTYFDQMHVIWYFLLACISSVLPNASNHLSITSDPLEQAPVSPI